MNQRFEQIYTANREAVRAYVRRRAPDAVVDDLVSETFLVCLRRIDQVPQEPLPWLYAVAWKTLANERRKQAGQHRATRCRSARPPQSVTVCSLQPSTP